MWAMYSLWSLSINEESFMTTTDDVVSRNSRLFGLSFEGHVDVKLKETVAFDVDKKIAVEKLHRHRGLVSFLSELLQGRQFVTKKIYEKDIIHCLMNR